MPKGKTEKRTTTTTRKNNSSNSNNGNSISNDDNNNKLEDLYRNIRLPGSYSGVETSRRYSSGKTRREEIDYLSGQDGYTLHKPIRRIKFRRRKVYCKGIADLIQANLVDLSSLARYNSGYRYLLTGIDVFTKRGWAIPVKNKTGRNCICIWSNTQRLKI